MQDKLLHGYCRRLIKYWQGTGRLFFADKAFGSVDLARKCSEWGVRCNLMTQTNRRGWPTGSFADADTIEAHGLASDRTDEKKWELGESTQLYRN